jgi:DNA-binding protein H-NS
MAIDTEEMSLAELQKAQQNLAEVIAKKRNAQLEEALVLVSDFLKEAELSMRDFIAFLDQKRPDPQQSVYVNPNNNEQKWKGLGRRPKWLIQALDNGFKLEDLLENE